MQYSQHTVGSRNPLKRWLHRSRFASSLKLLQIRPFDRLLDYGCGDEELAFRASDQFPAAEIVAFDPAEELYTQAEHRLAGRNNVRVTHTCPHGHFDRVACLETVEHLPPGELATALKNIDAMLKADSLCLITFPIEHGIMSLVKNCYRMSTGRDKYASPARAVRAFLGLTVAREPYESLSGCRYIYSHVGFNCRQMLVEISNYFMIRNVYVLPTGMLSFGLGNGLAVIATKRHFLIVFQSIIKIKRQAFLPTAPVRLPDLHDDGLFLVVAHIGECHPQDFDRRGKFGQ
jgi:hypothetical protein